MYGICVYDNEQQQDTGFSRLTMKGRKLPAMHITLQEINISHLGKRKIIFKYALSGGYVNSLEGIYFQHFHTLVGIASPKMNCWEDAIDLCKGHMDKTQRGASSYLYINGASIYILSIYLYSIYPSIHPYLYLYLSIYLSIHSSIDQWIDRLDVSKIAQKWRSNSRANMFWD